MAIVLKYGAPGPIIGAGYAAGVGRRQQKMQEEATKYQEAQLERDFRQGLQLGAFEQQKELQKGAFQQQQTLAGEQRKFQAREAELNRAQREDLANQNKEFLRYQATLLGLQRGELELPGKALDELKKLEDMRVESLNPRYTDQHRQEVMEHYEKRKPELIATATPKILPSRAELEEKQLQSQDEREQRKLQQAEGQDYNKNVTTLYLKNKAEKNPQDPEKNLYADDNAAFEAAKATIDLARQRLGQGQPAQPAAQPAPQIPVVTNRQDAIAKGLMKPGKTFAGQDGTIFQVQSDGLTTRPIGNLADQGQQQPLPAAAAPAQAAIASQPQGAAPPQGVTLDSLNKEDRALAEKLLPSPMSANDRNKLPQGTRYIAPDGSIRTRGVDG